MTPSEPVALLLARLDGVKALGTGWTARCPAHLDRHNSLKIDTGKDGQALIFCHAGCEAEAIVSALDLKFGDLYPAREDAAVQNGHGARIVATYDYRDESGALLYQVLRYVPKDFRQRRPDGRGGWSWKLGDTRRVLYRYPELLAADRAAWVLIGEGEKDCNSFTALGYVATTNAQGAGKWRHEYTKTLQDRRVVLLPDNDEAGERHMHQVAQSLDGVAAEVRLLRLPGLLPKGDPSDWLAAGHTVDELDQLIASAPAWTPDPTLGASGSAAPLGARLLISPLSAITAQPVDWPWPRWIPKGKFILVAGHAGDGKSTLLAALAAIGSKGGEWPDGTRAPRPMRTLFLLGEDAAADTLKPRLELHDADMDQVFVIEMVLDEKGQERYFNVSKHLDLLEVAIREHRIDWIVIDPLTTIMPGTDRNAEGDTRDALTPLIKLADRHNATITGVAHVGKSEGSRRAAQKILGATAFHALARVVWMIAPDEEERMVLGVVKSNLAIKPPSLVWSREEDGPIRWHGVSAQDVEDLLSSAPFSTPRADAEGYLREFLLGGSRASEEVERAAKARGIAFRTVQRAAGAVGINKFKERGVLSGRWFWSLPDGEPRYAGPSAANSAVNLANRGESGQVQESANLATSRDTQVANFGKFEDGQSLNGGHLHAMTPDSRKHELGHPPADVGQFPELGHPSVLRGGQVRTGKLASDVASGQVRIEPGDDAVVAMAKRIADLTSDELLAYRGEVAAVSLGDPFIAQEREALALFDAVQAAGNTP